MPCTPTFFSLGFVFREVSKKGGVFHTLCEELFMLNVTHSQVDTEIEFGVVPLMPLFL